VNFESVDVIAIIAIVCCTVLISLGHNSIIVSLLATIVGWYFGRSKGKNEEKLH
jgi:type II secretory pathway pseudopilin PulG